MPRKTKLDQILEEGRTNPEVLLSIDPDKLKGNPAAQAAVMEAYKEVQRRNQQKRTGTGNSDPAPLPAGPTPVTIEGFKPLSARASLRRARGLPAEEVKEAQIKMETLPSPARALSRVSTLETIKLVMALAIFAILIYKYIDAYRASPPSSFLTIPANMVCLNHANDRIWNSKA